MVCAAGSSMRRTASTAGTTKPSGHTRCGALRLSRPRSCRASRTRLILPCAR
ncbi:Uncharacterised protein [Bordetella pertussis]|nr:Uncharacterised protein [Bordetella pertussis]